MTNEEYSRHLALQIWLNCNCGSSYDQQKAAEIIKRALDRTEAKQERP